MKKQFQNLSCAFAQIAIKDFEYRNPFDFCLSQITEGKRFGKHTENFRKNFLSLKILVLLGGSR